ncbi:MAG: hypothetical protein V1851_00990 [Patescibacteria group bacterium]
MEPEEKRMLRENLELARENNSMLKKIKKSLFWGKVSRWVYWLILIGASLGAYYYVQPYVDATRDIIKSIKSGAGVVSDGVSETTTATTKAVQSLLDLGSSFLGN